MKFPWTKEPDRLGELGTLRKGKCPDCGSDQFQEGPSGGMSTNYRSTCGSEFNLTHWDGRLLFAERISPPGGNK